MKTRLVNHILKTAFVVITLIVTSLTLPAANPGEAETLISGMMARLRKAPSIEASFSVTANGSTSQAAILMSGKKFTLRAPEVSVWFNGKDQYTYSPQTGEVNITSPTVEELGEINPLAVIDNLSTRFKAVMAKPGTNGQKRVELTPLAKGDNIRKAIVTVGSSGYPSAIVLMMDNGQQLSVSIHQLKEGKKLAASTFEFRPALAPGAEVIDLR
ncbi:MAG: outer-membrane lipoprotein carrier protein LolA [Paramuribaculum sp.]|nr:outer-membrane lipoprotein carrier protein LolA [Paramuribaculum sp.]